ncbi:hypothetical protein [Mycobacterium sp.]|uniref:hypothetical protein n=1 Tax=Mycobacterium sp. TaxID=1785 RepID=UPI002B8E0DE8|nr:hypothetical protein [Mycobacterium sp.]HTQ19622.1 hypothetical protein [Mycobacterium sp.]
MFESPTTSATTPDVVQDTEPTLVDHGPSPEPVLITEQEVMFSTAVATSPRPVSTSRRFIDAIRGFGGAFRLPPPKRHYPQRSSYLEKARMAREMDRL